MTVLKEAEKEVQLISPKVKALHRELNEHMPDPSKCHAEGSGLHVAVVNEKSTAVVEIVNVLNQPCDSLFTIACEITTPDYITLQGSIKKLDLKPL